MRHRNGASIVAIKCWSIAKLFGLPYIAGSGRVELQNHLITSPKKTVLQADTF